MQQSKAIHMAHIVKDTLSTDIQPSDPRREQSSHIEALIIEKEKVSSSSNIH